MEFVEGFCVFTVCQILVVSAHPNKPLQPLVYEVPSLEKEVEATMRIWTGREVIFDVCGGGDNPDMSQDFESTIAAEQDWLTTEGQDAENSGLQSSQRPGPAHEAVARPEDADVHLQRRKKRVDCCLAQRNLCRSSMVSLNACGRRQPGRYRRYIHQER